MNAPTSSHWQTANQYSLSLALTEVRTALQQYIATLQGTAWIAKDTGPPDSEDTLGASSALEKLCTAFRLTAFERQVLLLSAGVELSASLANLCATAQGHPQWTYPTFSLALAALPDAHWSATTPARPLRHWRLIEVSDGESLTQGRLQIDERVLHYLTGVSYQDERLQGLFDRAPIPENLPPSHQKLASQIVAIWQRKSRVRHSETIQLCGDRDSTEAIAATACATTGLQLHTLRAIDIPSAVAEREALARLWEREAVLSRSALLLDCEMLSHADLFKTALPFIETIRGWLMIATQEPLQIRKRPSLRLDVNPPTEIEQRLLWQHYLEPRSAELADRLEEITTQFSLSPQAIRVACSEFTTQADAWNQPVMHLSVSSTADSVPFRTLWDICRKQSRTRLDDLAQRVSPIATWDDLVLPEPERQLLREIAAQVRHRAMVYETWQFAVRGANGLGISALFVGTSGTGKTLAAEVLANELRLDLYRIDLSQVVSKYIGETEKNLRRVFDAAEAGGSILLFDEADALFGKRSEVKDSHDRYANIEVSYLLQRMEAYRGLAILTTNLKGAIDPAFLRRIRFVVQFPFPDMSQRTEIWRRMFPPKLPTEAVDVNQLARLNIAGGNIRNIALNAAFLAADASEPVRMSHLLRATQAEYAKLERPLTEAEVGGWI